MSKHSAKTAREGAKTPLSKSINIPTEIYKTPVPGLYSHTKKKLKSKISPRSPFMRKTTQEKPYSNQITIRSIKPEHNNI